MKIGFVENDNSVMEVAIVYFLIRCGSCKGEERIEN